MKIAFFSKKKYEQQLFDQINSSYGHEINYFEEQLNPQTAFLSQNSEVVCVFVNDIVNAATLDKFSAGNIRLIALRCAGFNNVDVPTATKLGISVVRVPAYSPYSVAEHTVGLILTLNRKIHRAYNRVKEGNFMLDGLMGFDLHQLTVGIIGTGKIGEVVARIMRGFGCHLIAYDLHPNPECEKIGVKYVGLNELFAQSDIITLHCPLNPKTYHLINRENIAQMKPGVMLINTSRGALIHTTAVIEGLKSQKIAYLGLECIRRRRRPIFPGPLSGSLISEYHLTSEKNEGDLFFQDLSQEVIQDDVFMRLLTFPNVLITGHQAFFTRNALSNIAQTTLENISDFEKGLILKNAIQL